MRSAMFVLIVVVTGTGGEIAVSHAMKQIGETRTFTPFALFCVLVRAFKARVMWVGVGLRAASFFSFLALLSWENVSLVVPATALSYVTGTLGAKFLLREQISRVRWAGAALVCLGVALVWAG